MAKKRREQGVTDDEGVVEVIPDKRSRLRDPAINAGSATVPDHGVRVAYSAELGLTIQPYPENSDDTGNLLTTVEEAVSQVEHERLENYFSFMNIDFVVSVRAVSTTKAASLSLAVDDAVMVFIELSEHEFDLAISKAREFDCWTFKHDDWKVDLTFIPCQPSDKRGRGWGILEDFREQFKEAQNAREAIDSQRDEWLHSQAEPLLDAIGEELKKSSLPTADRKDLQKLQETLRGDAYGYTKLIDANTAKEFFNLSYSRFQTLVQEGRLGYPLSRFYVHSAEEARRMAAKERPEGRPPE